MAEDSVKFVINIEEQIDHSEIEKIKNELRDELDEPEIDIEKIKNELRNELREEKKTRDITPKRFEPNIQGGGSRSPVTPPIPAENRGGIFIKTDPPVKGFEKRQAIRGGVQRLRDDRSRQAFQHEKWLEQIKRIEDGIEKNRIQGVAVENFITKNINPAIRGAQAIQNPEGMVGDTMLKMLGGSGPYGPAIIAAIGAIVTSAEVAKQLIRTLSEKGLPLNRDWERIIEDEMNSLFSIEEKKKRLLGLDGFVVTQTDRFQPDSGSTTYNSLENRDEVTISKISAGEKSVGVV